MDTQTVESVFSRSWQLLKTNWVIVVPGLLIGLISGVITAVLNPPVDVSGTAGVGALAVSGFARLLATLITLALTIASLAYTTGMAGAAWQRGTTQLSDGTRAFERDAGNILVAMIAMYVVGIVAVVCSIFTLGLALLAYVFFTIYTMAAAVVGERGGVAAMAESYRIALRRPAPTAIMVVLLAVVVVAVGFVAALLSAAPLIGPIIAGLVFQAIVAYVTLVIVGEYLALRGAGQP